MQNFLTAADPRSPRRGCTNLLFGIFFAKNCMEMEKNDRGEVGGGCALIAPPPHLDPAMRISLSVMTSLSSSVDSTILDYCNLLGRGDQSALGPT